MKFDDPIPPELAHLKRDERGYPIPFFVSMVGHKPQFQLISQQKQIICVEKKLCPICGKKLYKDGAYFISGPMGLYNRVSTDPGMHRVCAEFSLRACPHIYYEKSKRREIKGEVAETLGPDDHMAKEKAPEIYMAKASKFSLDKLDNGATVIDFILVSWQRYIYKNGFLEIDNSPEGRGGSKFELSAEKERERQGATFNAIFKSVNPQRKK